MFDLSLLKSAGKDVYIGDRVDIRRPHLVSIGSHVAIDNGFYISTAADIGDYIHIAPYVTIIGGGTGFLKMGHFTNISTGGKIICGSDNFSGDGLVTAPGIPRKFRDSLNIAQIY